MRDTLAHLELFTHLLEHRKSQIWTPEVQKETTLHADSLKFFSTLLATLSRDKFNPAESN